MEIELQYILKVDLTADTRRTVNPDSNRIVSYS